MSSSSTSVLDIDDMSWADISEDDSRTRINNIHSRRQLLAEDSDSEDNKNNISDYILSDSKGWFAPVGSAAFVPPFVSSTGVKFETAQQLSQAKPQDFFQLMVTDNIFQTIATETNRYADQVINGTATGKFSRINVWSPTNEAEIKKFFGLIIWMGLVKLPSVSLYWSQDVAFRQTFPISVMSRNRFELLLQMLHFTDNITANPKDRLTKIRFIIDELNKNYSAHYHPEEYVYINEGVIPFRGGIAFRQYVKSNSHKYDMKLFKLCTISGYTHGLRVCCKKNANISASEPANVAMELMHTLLYKGHTLCTNSWFTSLDLANRLLADGTHLVGTIRNDRKGLPKEVTKQKLNRNEIAAKQNSNGVTVLKWRNARDVTMLSTKHGIEYKHINTKRGNVVQKPIMVVDYNRGKAAVDLSDQMAAYCSSLRKTVKWYRKLAIELLLNTSIVNSFVMFKDVTKENITIVEFRKRLALHLISNGEFIEPPSSESNSATRTHHEILRKKGMVKNIRRYCTRCYQLNSKFSRQVARTKTVKVVTYCGGCDGQPHLCLSCFNVKHQNISV